MLSRGSPGSPPLVVEFQDWLLLLCKPGNLFFGSGTGNHALRHALRAISTLIKSLRWLDYEALKPLLVELCFFEGSFSWPSVMKDKIRSHWMRPLKLVWLGLRLHESFNPEPARDFRTFMKECKKCWLEFMAPHLRILIMAKCCSLGNLSLHFVDLAIDVPQATATRGVISHDLRLELGLYWNKSEFERLSGKVWFIVDTYFNLNHFFTLVLIILRLTFWLISSL